MRSYICWFTLLVVATAKADLVQAKSFYQISHVGTGVQGFGPSSTTFPSTLGSWIRSGADGT